MMYAPDTSDSLRECPQCERLYNRNRDQCPYCVLVKCVHPADKLTIDGFSDNGIVLVATGHCECGEQLEWKTRWGEK